MEEASPCVGLGSPTGTPLSEDTPTSIRRKPHFPEPMCSPIACDGSPMMAFGSPCSALPCPTPSPGSKKFVGMSDNVRNNMYMKSLMSPYQKSYTPLSATPGFSPAYQTPLRATRLDKAESPCPTSASKSHHPSASSSRSPHPGVTSTPQGSQPPGSGRRFVTPKNIVNPFENGVDDLHLPAYLSPGFFTVASTPASEERKHFRWSIEHISELQPADIPVDEMSVHRSQPPVRMDRETEERAQRAIDQFFANNLIVPSPWSDPHKAKKKNILPATPDPHGAGVGQKEEMMSELQGSIQKSLPPKQGTQDACCQTMLSLPLNFDLQKVLGAYMNADCDDGNQADMLSTSSLRRKLFFHGDTSSVAPSPVKDVSDNVHFEAASPMFAKHDRITPLKNTPAFSSSPIKSCGTPGHTGADPEFLASPELSPIVHGNLPKLRKSRSSGVFQVHTDNIEESPSCQFSEHRHHSPVSPIPFDGLSPDNDDEHFRPKFEDSPGFSPIRPPKTPIRKILRKSQEESYLQDDMCESDDDGESMTPVSSSQNIPSASITPVETILSPLASNSPLKSSGTELKHRPSMDYETAVYHPRENMLTSSFCDTGDFTSSVDYPDDTHQQTSLSNQDTGYQTASLQSTNTESVSMHTNLTNQFGSLPFNLTNQESALHTSSYMPTTKQEKGPTMNITRHLSLLKPDKADLSFDIEKRDIYSTTSALFPKQKLLFLDDDEDDDEYSQQHDHETPTQNAVAANFNKFHDSALPDDYQEFSRDRSDSVSSYRNMEVDPGVNVSHIGLGDMDCISSQEKLVLGRARQALAMANNLYPQVGDVGQDDGSHGDTAGNLSACEDGDYHPPSILQKSYSASKLAKSIIQRAGEDLVKYGSVTTGKKTRELTMDGIQDH